MTVSSLTSTNATPRTTSVAPARASSASNGAAAQGSVSSGATILSCSTPGQLMAKMRQLADTNPAEFRLLAAEMGRQFEQAAGDASGQDAQLLAKVSTQFQQAAQTGTLEPSEASATADAGSGAGAIDAAGASDSATRSGDPARPSHAHLRDHRSKITRESWESAPVQQAFADALDVFTSATGEGSSS